MKKTEKSKYQKNDEKSQKNILTFKNEFGILLMHLRKVENDLWKLSKMSILKK